MGVSSNQADIVNEAPSMQAIIAPMVAIILGCFMVFLDGTAMNVALSGFMEEFGKSISVVTWVTTGYALAQAAVIPLAGWLSDRFGAKRVFLISIGLFTISSLFCAFANSIEMLIVFRILQGLGGGMITPISMAIIFRLSPPEKLGAVMGILGIPIILAPALGPVISGILIVNASWHWIFLINIPVGIIALLTGGRKLPKIESQSTAYFDILGMIFGPLAFAALSYGVSEGSADWTSAHTLTGLTVGTVSLILFIAIELTRKQPLLELQVFRSMDFTKGILVQWIAQIAMFGSSFMVPMLLISVKSYSAMEAGFIMLPQTVFSGIFMTISGRLFDKTGARPLLFVGLGVVSWAAFLLSGLSPNDGILKIMLALALFGTGMGLSMMPLNTYLLKAAPPQLVGRVTSLTSAMQQVMTSLAIAGLSTILTTHLANKAAGNSSPSVEIYFDAFGETYLVVVGLGIIGALLALLLRKLNQVSK